MGDVDATSSYKIVCDAYVTQGYKTQREAEEARARTSTYAPSPCLLRHTVTLTNMPSGSRG